MEKKKKKEVKIKVKLHDGQQFDINRVQEQEEEMNVEKQIEEFERNNSELSYFSGKSFGY